MRRLSITYILLTMLVLVLSAFAPFKIKPSVRRTVTIESKYEANAQAVYSGLNANHFNMPKLESFSKALTGFYQLKGKGLVQKNILTLIDFSLSSNTRRLWVINLDTNTILYNSLVAHGMKTGEEFAKSFSNQNSSYKSSLGFYTTGETYNGKHGMSLKLDGLEQGLNSNARARGVVMHSADYVSEAFIRLHKRLGRSQGCPALPKEVTADIINTIKNKSCLFIYHPSLNSKLIKG